MYWIGVAFGIGLTVFIGGVLVETEMIFITPDRPLPLIRSCGALLAACASILAVVYRRRHPANLNPNKKS
jgi:hypothetical protein